MLVLCMSANAFGSDWAQLESGTFRFRDPLNKERRFIPLRLDDAPIKGSLAQFLYINWHPAEREQEYAKLLEACRPPAPTTPDKAEVIGEHSVDEIRLQLKDTGDIWTYSFDPHSKHLLAGGNGKIVWLCRMDNGTCVQAFKGHTQGIRSVVWSKDCSRALSASEDKTLRLWDTATGQCLRVFEGHDDKVSSAVWSR